jgi:hypothetical protein
MRVQKKTNRNAFVRLGWLMTIFSVLIAGLLASGCGTSPDWQALYAQRLGQPISELDTAPLDQEFVDPVEGGSLTRATWARFRDESMALLGLPAHQPDAQKVVESTVVLQQEEWQRACADALGEDEVWGWRLPHAHRGNSIRIYLNNQHETYCEFFFLPSGWELRTVHSQGILKPFHRP